MLSVKKQGTILEDIKYVQTNSQSYLLYLENQYPFCENKYDESILKEWFDRMAETFKITSLVCFDKIEVGYDYKSLSEEVKHNLIKHFFIGKMKFVFEQTKPFSKEEWDKFFEEIILGSLDYDTVYGEELINLINLRTHHNRVYSSITKSHFRDPILAHLLKRFYNFKCMICNTEIIKQDGNKYSESHHVIPLSVGGLDSPDNIAIVCPNCHKKFHVAELKEKNKMSLIFKKRNYWLKLTNYN